MDGTARTGLAPLTRGLLIGAPLVMVAGRLLAVPFDDQRWDDVLTQAAAHPGRSDTGWLLSLVACGLFAASAAPLAGLLSGRRLASAFVSVAMSLGWVGAAGISTAGLVFSVMGKAPDRAQQVRVLTDLNAGSTFYVFLLGVLGAVGYVVLAVGLARAGLLRKGAAVLFGLGGAGTLLCMPGPAKPLAVAFGLMLLAGQVLLIRSVGSVVEPELRWEPVSA